MHASPKIGLIAGDGEIPLMLLSAWQRMGLTPIVINLTDRKDFLGVEQACYAMGQAAHIVSFLKLHDVKDLVIIGKVTRPNFLSLRADFKGLTLIARLLLDTMTRGDDGLLKFVRRAFEDEGFSVRAAQDFLPELLCTQGVLTTQQPTSEDITAINKGFTTAKEHGLQDKGQSVVVIDGKVVGREGRSGTNALIESYTTIDGRKVLVKVSKPQQDMALDAPTIGPTTIEILARAGYVGLAVEAGRTLIVERDKVIEACHKTGLFLVGI